MSQNQQNNQAKSTKPIRWRYMRIEQKDVRFSARRMKDELSKNIWAKRKQNFIAALCSLFFPYFILKRFLE
jgi:hypothetical protein